MSKKSGFFAAALALVMVLLAGIWFFARPETTAGEKELTIQVIHGDRSQKEYEITTSAEYLAEALLENNIVEDNQGVYGLYILTADAETADESRQEWWCITKGGESLMTGASETPVADGETYELTFMVGYGG